MRVGLARLAMLEARKPVPSTDLLVVRARAVLDRVDRLYAEDARRIAELTELFWREIRSEGHEASALAILEGSTAWRHPAYFAGGQRAFEEYVVLYATLRIGQDGRPGMSHGRAMATLKATGRARDQGGP